LESDLPFPFLSFSSFLFTSCFPMVHPEPVNGLLFFGPPPIPFSLTFPFYIVRSSFPWFQLMVRVVSSQCSTCRTEILRFPSPDLTCPSPTLLVFFALHFPSRFTRHAYFFCGFHDPSTGCETGPWVFLYISRTKLFSCLPRASPLFFPDGTAHVQLRSVTPPFSFSAPSEVGVVPFCFFQIS